jgi:hypothetical protein
MNRKEMIEKNLELQYYLMMELLRDPDGLDVPDDAETIFLPEDDESLREANLQLGKRREKLGKHVVYVQVKLVPETRTVLTPKLMVIPSA